MIKRICTSGLVVVFLGLSACSEEPANDPRVTGFPIAYVKRPFPLTDPDQDNAVIQPDVREPLQFYPGSDLYIRDHATVQAPERNVTAGETQGNGDVKDLEVSYDGKKLLFALKKPDIEGRQPEEQPTWNIWEYDIEKGGLRRIIKQDVFSEEGNDVAPYYLPDGRIVFSSTRQYGSKEMLTNEAKPRYTSLVDQEQNNNRQAMMLHVMNSDGTNIQQITFAPVMDLDPIVRTDGKIVFSRWDRYVQNSAVNIYSINPDGTDLQLLYGAHSHNPGISPEPIQFTQLREFPDGSLLSIMRSFTNTYGGGDLVLVDAETYADYEKPTRDYRGSSGTGLSSLTGRSASAASTPTLGGRFISAYPLWDGSNRSLVSWTACFLGEGENRVPCSSSALESPNAREANPVYNVYLYDHSSQTRQSIFLPEAGKAITDVVAAQSRAYPRQLADTVEGVSDKTGIIHIRSVYDYDGTFNDRGSPVTVTSTDDPISEFIQITTPDDRPARFLRLIKPFVRSDRNDFQIDNLAFGRSPDRDGLMEILGYARIEPDGSVKVRVPANLPFSFQIVDKNGRRIGEQRHRSWLQVRKGETLECHGCHNHNSDTPHGRKDAIEPVNKGAQSIGPFAGQDAAMIAQTGETMAETRMRYSCDTDSCNALKPTIDIVYVDDWSVSKASPFDYKYIDVFNFADNVPDPVSESCITSWNHRCRNIINYVTHIDPLWSKPRTRGMAAENVTCSKSSCHSPTNDMGNPAVPKPSIPFPFVDVPPRTPPATSGSQLNLDNISSNDQDDDADRLEAYVELLFDDNLQELDGTNNLIDAVFYEEERDADGNPTGNFIPINVTTRPGRPMIQGSANGSRFFNELENDSPVGSPAAPDNQFDHTGILSPAELKLISEWLDIGAQYYNDPFAVPD